MSASIDALSINFHDRVTVTDLPIDADISHDCAAILSFLRKSGLIDFNGIDSSYSLKANVVGGNVILKFVRQLQSLQKIVIPQDALDVDEAADVYYAFSSSVGGVTEKAVLISAQTLRSKLRRLNEALAQAEDVPALCQDIMCAEAMIKYPKNSAVRKNVLIEEEVQAEFLALQLALLLGFRDTCQARMISHFIQGRQRPALFVKFDDISLLQEFISQGEMRDAVILGCGEGLLPDRHIEDLGQYFTYLFLCSDPDALGKIGQNKGIIRLSKLYIFDQVIKNGLSVFDNFKLDSNLNMTAPSLKSKSRHHRGRNKSLVEDASIVSKYNSMIAALRQRNEILDLFQFTIVAHLDTLKRLKSQRPQQKQLIKQVENLKAAAYEHHNYVAERLGAMDRFLPQYQCQQSGEKYLPPYEASDEVKDNVGQLFLLQQCLASPVLYREDGLPFRSIRPTTKAAKIELIIDKGEQLEVQYSGELNQEMLEYLGKTLGITSQNKRSYLIPKASLALVNEAMIFPEFSETLDTMASFVDSVALRRLQQRYESCSQSAKANQLLENYRRKLYDNAADSVKAGQMKSTLLDFKTLIQIASRQRHAHLGYITHAYRCLHFDVIKQICHLHSVAQNPALVDKIKQAFTAAIRIDCLNSLTLLITTTVNKGQLDNCRFHQLLDLLIQYGHDMTSYKVSSVRSRRFAEKVTDLIIEFSDTHLMHLPQQGSSGLMLHLLCDYKPSLRRQSTGSSCGRTKANEPDSPVVAIGVADVQADSEEHPTHRQEPFSDIDHRTCFLTA